MSQNNFSYCLLNDYLSDPLRSEMLSLALDCWDSKRVKYQPCGKRGYFNLNDEHEDYSLICDGIVKCIMESAGVNQSYYVTSRHFIGINLPTACVSPHTDMIQFADVSKIKTPVEVRINTFLQRPDGGGVPVIAGEPVPIPNGCSLAFNAGITHSSTPVEGETVRAVLSVSAVVESAKCNRLLDMARKLND